MTKFRLGLIGYGLAWLLIFTAPLWAQTANGRATTAAPTYSNNTAAPLSLDLNGSLRVINSGSPSGTQDVNITEVGGNAVTTTVPVSGTVTATGPLTDAQLRASAVPVTGTITAVTAITNALPAGNNNIGDVDVASLPALPAGNNNIGDVDVASLPALPAGNNNIGDVDVATMPGAGSTGAAVPATANYIAANSGGNLTGLIVCNSSVVYDASTSGNTELVALTGGQTIRVCGYSIMAGGTVNVRLVRGTGTACATGETSLTPAWQLTAQSGIVDGSPFFRGMAGASGDALCIETNGAVAVQAIVYYTKF